MISGIYRNSITSYFLTDFGFIMSPDNDIRPEQVRAARSLLSWSQQDLAAKAGVAISTLADFERGQRSPVPNNALAIRKALEVAGIVFTETGVGHGFHWTFMTERGMCGVIITFTPETAAPVIDFASIFGKVEPPKISIDKIQCATPELRRKAADFVARYGAKAPHLHRVQKMLNDTPDGEFFLLLPTPPSSTAEKFRYEQVLHQLNHPDEQPLDEYLPIFGRLMERYDIHNPRTDKRIDIGNARKADRTCRFCGRTLETGARFEKEAHAIPAALGNKYLKLSDECDECNQHFGDTVEQTLIELLNIQRVFLGIEARGASPAPTFSGGRLFRDKKDEKPLMVVVSEKISEDAAGVLRAQLGTGKLIIPQNFYRALSKIALSVIPEGELPSLKRTIRWVRYGDFSDSALPTIAASVVMLPPTLPPKSLSTSARSPIRRCLMSCANSDSAATSMSMHSHSRSMTKEIWLGSSTARISSRRSSTMHLSPHGVSKTTAELRKSR